MIHKLLMSNAQPTTRIDHHDGTVTCADGRLYVKDSRGALADYDVAVRLYADAEDGIDAQIARQSRR